MYRYSPDLYPHFCGDLFYQEALMKDPKSVGEEIHKFVEVLLVESASELQKAFIESVLTGTGTTDLMR